MHVLVWILSFNLVLICFWDEFWSVHAGTMLAKIEMEVKQGKTGEKKPRLSNFRTTHPLCEFAFVPILKKCMLSVPSQNLSANFTGMRTLCQPCANSFLWQNFKTMLSVLENHRNDKFSHNTRTTPSLVRKFRTTHPLLRNFRTTLPLCEFFTFSIPTLPNPKPQSLISLLPHA